MNPTPMRSVSYLLDTCQNADGPVKGPAGYYLADGTWPGRWRGAGLAGLGLSAGATVGRAEAIALFHQFAHPITGAALGRTPAPDSQVVNAFDLTFRVPKSVSLLWAVADEDTRRQIWDAHTDAIAAALDWVEDEVLRTRSGRNGVAVEATRGLVAAAFDHFESRDGDPHLHTHVAVANRVQRARDGAWRTIDGAALLRSAVAASELHDGLLVDLLHERLGMTFSERARPGVSSRAVVADVAGVDGGLVEAFSSRDRAITRRLGELTAAWSSEHGGVAPPRRVVEALKLSAWAGTRKAKKKSPDSLATLTRRWRAELGDLGVDAAGLVAGCVGHPVRQLAVGRIASDPATVEALARLVLSERSATHKGKTAPEQIEACEVADYLSDLAAGTVDDPGASTQLTADLARVVHDDLATTRATWTRRQAEAGADRLTKLLPCPPGDRLRLRAAITEAALAMCVPLTETRYRLPAGASLAVAAGGRSVFDETTRAVFTSRRVLDAEARLHHATTTDLPGTACGSLDPDHVRTALAARRTSGGHPLAGDQRRAVEHLACAPRRLAAMVGPAGTGKTTSLRALVDLWTDQHGPGHVLALAPSARAARVLRGELAGVDATTLAGFVTANTAPVRAHRAAWIEQCQARHARARTAAGRARAGRTLATALAQDASVTVRPGSLVIVDEAAMATTADLDLVLGEVERAGARLVLVGDPAQLDAVGAGGILGRLDRTGHAAHLTSIFRFTEAWQAEASTRLRDGDPTVFLPSQRSENGPPPPPTYADVGWVHDGSSEGMLEGAYRATTAALARGEDAVLLVATNEDLSDLNTRATLERRAAGLVDARALVRLAGRADAGAGDLLIARRNEHQITDTSKDRIENSDLLRLLQVNADGSALCRRVTGAADTGQQGAMIVLPATYLRTNVELGYALTAHRAQGITVDEAHLVIPDGAHMTRELAYVALTRARGANHLWTALPDVEQMRAEHTPVFAPGPDGTLRPVEHTAATIMARALRATAAQSTAHEVAETEHERTTGLATLAAEHEHVAHLAAETRLRALLVDLHGPDHAEAYTASPAWEALVATFTRADALHPDRTARLLAVPHHRGTDPVPGELDLFGKAPVTHPATPGPRPTHADPAGPTPSDQEAPAMIRPRRVDPTAGDDDPGTDNDADDEAGGVREGEPRPVDAARLAHWTLNAAIVRPHLAAGAGTGWVAGLTPPVTAGPADLVDVAGQAEAMIAARTRHLHDLITAEEPPAWVHALPACPEAAFDPEGAAAWDRAALAVAVYRDTFTIETDTPLGPEPDDAHQAHARTTAARLLDRLVTTRTPPAPAQWAPAADPHADPDIDWSALDPGEVTALTRREAATMHHWRPLHDPDTTTDPAPDPTVDTGDGDGRVLWDPAYALPVPATPDWQHPTTARTDVDPGRLDRLAAANQAAYTFWQAQAAGPRSWVGAYLSDRALTTVVPAHAPAGWTSTYDHLRGAGFTDTELLDAGLVTRTRRGTLVDRFRDRLALPLHDTDGRLAGFTARANPTTTDPGTPKYLNTPTTDLFDKSTTLAGLDPTTRDALAHGATPVLVEGALDAAAVTAATEGRAIGLAPCGTALTPAQLRALATTRDGSLDGLVIGFDDDGAGRAAAVRAWHLLGARTAAGTRQAVWGGAKDPADLATTTGPDAVTHAVQDARPLVDQLVADHLTGMDLTTVEGRVYTARAIAGDLIDALDQQLLDTAGDLLIDACSATGVEAATARATWDVATGQALLAHSTALEEHAPLLPEVVQQEAHRIDAHHESHPSPS